MKKKEGKYLATSVLRLLRDKLHAESYFMNKEKGVIEVGIVFSDRTISGMGKTLSDAMKSLDKKIRKVGLSGITNAD